MACKHIESELSPVFMPVSEVLTGLTEKVHKGSVPLSVITGKKGINGACVLLDKEFLVSVAERFGEGFVILPSSIHECLILPLSSVPDFDGLRSMVSFVNATEVKLFEILSNNVYKFDVNSKEVVML